MNEEHEVSATRGSVRVLLVGMANSVHIARWLRQFSDSQITFVLFPSGPHRRLHPQILRLTQNVQDKESVKVSPSMLRFFGLPIFFLDKIFHNRIRALMLQRMLRKNHFDLIHVQELQHAGYIVAKAFRKSPPIPLLVTNWGSDIYWFYRFPRHRKLLTHLLSLATHYSCECDRDVDIARKLGFTGRVAAVQPNAGGLEISQLTVPGSPTSERRKVIVKGYTGFVGRGLDALRAISAVSHHLRDYEVVVYSASRKTQVYALFLRLKHGIKIRTYRPGLSHEQMLKEFRESRIYLGISDSDGISTSLLEAMSQGCFPIQSNTSCASEWIQEGSGFMPDPNNGSEISRCLEQALLNDDMVNLGAAMNISTIFRKANADQIAENSKLIYLNVLNGEISTLDQRFVGDAL
jgi:glycosyltransferase involved in cell wall biosynthesis